MAQLTIEIDGQHVTSRTLQTTLDLGRSSQCGLSFAILFLSRRHLRLQRTSEGWRAIDLGSTNGTWIGGVRITDHLLQDGQVIQLGNLALTFHEPASSPDYSASPRTKTPSLWEIAMKPTPPTAPQSNSHPENSRRASNQSGPDRRNPATPSLRGRWSDLLVRFDTDIKFKGGLALGLIVLLGLGTLYCLQANGFARSDESRINPAALNSHAQTTSPASRANAMRDLPV